MNGTVRVVGTCRYAHEIDFPAPDGTELAENHNQTEVFVACHACGHSTNCGKDYDEKKHA